MREFSWRPPISVHGFANFNHYLTNRSESISRNATQNINLVGLYTAKLRKTLSILRVTLLSFVSSVGDGSKIHQSQPVPTTDLGFAETQCSVTRTGLLLLAFSFADKVEYLHPFANHFCPRPLVLPPFQSL